MIRTCVFLPPAMVVVMAQANHHHLRYITSDEIGTNLDFLRGALSHTVTDSFNVNQIKHCKGHDGGLFGDSIAKDPE